VNCLRRNRGDAAGVKSGASPVDRTTVNVGTIRFRSTVIDPWPGVRTGIGATPAEGADGTEPS
jgi:hypothetical protein